MAPAGAGLPTRGHSSREHGAHREDHAGLVPHRLRAVPTRSAGGKSSARIPVASHYDARRVRADPAPASTPASPAHVPKLAAGDPQMEGSA